MTELNPFYNKLLSFGLIALREAVRCGDLEWAEAEIELLHNIPSLLEESNPERHRYFWCTERDAYIKWVEFCDREKVKRRLRLYYEPLWDGMKAIMLESLSCSSAAENK
ncbi:MAG TPA: hypothetical protein VGK58_12365 [Lacipirellulaceae bacterium]